MKTYLALVGTSLLVACSTVPSQQAATQPVELRFLAEVNGQAFECGQSYKNIGTTRSTMTPNDFRMFVSQVHLMTAEGKAVPVQLVQDSTWQLEGIALLDFENGQGPCVNGTPPMNTVVRGIAPVGQYTGVKFTVGVPFERNHGDPTVAPAPLSSTAMFWTWQAGYKFIKFDASTSGRPLHTAQSAAHGSASASGFSVHLGSTLCASPARTQAPSACQNPNRIDVTLIDFDLKKNQVVVDMGRVLARSNVDVNAPKTSPGCMSFPKDADCPLIMNALGLPYDGKAPSSPQQFIIKR
ncbi:AZL_007920_fam, AZL_007920/MXAN_0976 family protein [Burkholderiaceae bacterium]